MATATASARFAPKDRTKREHVAAVERVVWSAEDESSCILRLTDGASAIGPAAASQFGQGTLYRFLGRWEDGKFGPEFKFQTYAIHGHQSAGSIIRYLSKTCRNVGEATARALFREFDTDAVKTLREQPDAVAAAGVMTANAAAEAAEDLKQFARFEETRIDLFGLFAGRGLPGKLIDRCISTWGARAPVVVRQNPFSLMVRRLPGAGFKRCDKMYLDFGRPPAALKRSALACWHAMKEDRTGSTWLDAREVMGTLRELIPNADALRSMVLLRRAGWARVRRDGSARFISPRDRADAEQRIADSVHRLLKHPSHWPAALIEPGTDGVPSAHQVIELRLACAKSVGCFGGGPGSGKTTTLAFLLQQVIADYGRDAVAVAAPTGKAAVRAGESLRARGLDITATTIHRLLRIGRTGYDGNGWGFEFNRDNPLDVRFLVLDETSMVDATLMADLLDALPDGACVLLVGDTYQLPPVGHGAPLRDILADTSASRGELTEIRRNAGSIVRACSAIKAGMPVEFPTRLDLDGDDKLNLKLIEVGQVETAQAVEDVLKALTRFDRVWETQVITGLNDKSESSRVKLNARLAKLLNPDGFSVKKNPFCVGDKIICKRNASLKVVVPVSKFRDAQMACEANWYQKPATATASTPAEWYVANGEIGRVVAVSETHTVARFGGADVPLVQIPLGKPKVNDEGETENAADGGHTLDFQPAWAITVHGAQGSEWPCVLCVIDDAASKIADRNYWYTAISRARSLCILVGPRGVFDRQVKRQSIDRRRTFLPELLKEVSTDGLDV